MNTEQIVVRWKNGPVRNKIKRRRLEIQTGGVRRAPKILPAMSIEITYKTFPEEVGYTRLEQDILFQFLGLYGKERTQQQFDPFDLREAFLGIKTPGEAVDFLSSSGHFRGGYDVIIPDAYWSDRWSFLIAPPDSHWNRILWSEFQGWQEVLRLLLAGGGRIPWLDGVGNESGRYDLAENLIELVHGLDKVERDWLEGVPTGIIIRADGKRKDSHGRNEVYAEIHVCTTLEAILATAYIDSLNGVKYALCALPDCDRVFEVTSKHEREYCSQPCAHKASMRRRRAAAKAAQAAKVEKPKKGKKDA